MCSNKPVPSKNSYYLKHTTAHGFTSLFVVRQRLHELRTMQACLHLWWNNIDDVVLRNKITFFSLTFQSISWFYKTKTYKHGMKFNTSKWLKCPCSNCIAWSRMFLILWNTECNTSADTGSPSFPNDILSLIDWMWGLCNENGSCG